MEIYNVMKRKSFYKYPSQFSFETEIGNAMNPSSNSTICLLRVVLH